LFKNKSQSQEPSLNTSHKKELSLNTNSSKEPWLNTPLKLTMSLNTSHKRESSLNTKPLKDKSLNKSQLKDGKRKLTTNLSPNQLSTILNNKHAPLDKHAYLNKHVSLDKHTPLDNASLEQPAWLILTFNQHTQLESPNVYLKLMELPTQQPNINQWHMELPLKPGNQQPEPPLYLLEKLDKSWEDNNSNQDQSLEEILSWPTQFH